MHFTDVASTALNLTSTIDAQVDDVTISGSHNKGGDGNGYGIELYEAFNKAQFASRICSCYVLCEIRGID